MLAQQFFITKAFKQVVGRLGREANLLVEKVATLFRIAFSRVSEIQTGLEQ